MSLSFICPHCNASIVVQSLKPGEVCKCHQCGMECSVPVDATLVGQPSSVASQPIMSSSPPRPPAARAELADRLGRLGARVIDALLVVPLVLIWVIVASTSRSDFGEIIGLIMFWVGLGVLIVYQWYLLSTEGQTIGKRMLKIKVVKLDGTNGGFVTNVLMREILNGLIGIIPLYALIDILFIFSEEQRCIHDHIASTRVIRCG